MTVRAKMKCFTVTPLASGDPNERMAQIHLLPVYSDSEENKTWSKYTPNGEIRLYVTNPVAIEQFEAGKEYFVDFTPAS